MRPINGRRREKRKRRTRSVDALAEVTYEGGHTEFLHFRSAVLALFFSREADSAVPFLLNATNNVGGENLTVQLSCLYAVRYPCCLHAGWLLSFFRTIFFRRGMGGCECAVCLARKIGHRMDPIRRQHRDRSLFTATVFNSIPLEHL